MGNDRSKKNLQKTSTPAQDSARVAENVNKREEARRRSEQRKREKEAEAESKIVEAEAEKKAPEIYKEYRRLIAKAEKAGQRTLQTDTENWSGSYYGEEPKISSEERRKLSVASKARDLARKMLEKDGYKIESDGWEKDTAWGVGSDSLPTAGSSCSWIVISW